MIENRHELARTPAHEVALAAIESGLLAAQPSTVIDETITYDSETDKLRIKTDTYDLAEVDNVYVIGGGNAAGAIAQALEGVLGDRITAGIVVTDDTRPTESIECLPGDHPVPSSRGVESTARMCTLAGEASEGDLVLAVIGGGGSALMTAPVQRVPLEELRDVTEALLASGASIDEINAVRKHLSTVKGGHLARRTAPARVVGLVFSDVIGDDLTVVASGPTVPDPTTFTDALDVVERYDFDFPDGVRNHLLSGTEGECPETPKPGDPGLESVTHHVLANGTTVLRSAAAVAREAGFEPLVLSSRIRGEAREAATVLVGIAEECAATGTPVEPPAVLLSGGETTVTVGGDGIGGPNHEYVLASALAVADEKTVIASVDTDGIDGNSEGAGAIATGATAEPRAEARTALQANDSGAFLAQRGAQLITGPTGTNVNDLRVLVVPETQAENADT